MIVEVKLHFASEMYARILCFILWVKVMDTGFTYGFSIVETSSICQNAVVDFCIFMVWGLFIYV